MLGTGTFRGHSVAGRESNPRPAGFAASNDPPHPQSRVYHRVHAAGSVRPSEQAMRDLRVPPVFDLVPELMERKDQGFRQLVPCSTTPTPRACWPTPT